MDTPRLNLVGRKEIRKANPFFLCNLVACRPLQLLNGYAGRSVPRAHISWLVTNVFFLLLRSSFFRKGAAFGPFQMD